MRLGILITGPNASGKTTATEQAIAPWRGDTRLASVFADNSDRSAFKGTQSEIEDRLLVFWDSPADVLIVEGTNRIAMAVGRVVRRSNTREWEAHGTRVSPEFLGWAIESRCKIKGKRFRSDYWTPRILKYESGGRFDTINRLWLADRMRWWPIAGENYDGSADLRDYIRSRVYSVLGDPVMAPTTPVEPRSAPPSQGILF